jgi:hypothetical protein
MRTNKNWADLKKSTARMVYFFAKRVAINYNMDLKHCKQKAEEIQWDSIQDFDESKNAKFSTYLYGQLKGLYSWAHREKEFFASIPEEIYLQVPAPAKEKQKLEVPKHLHILSHAIVMGYGFYSKDGKLSLMKKSLKDLSNYTGLPSSQIYLQLAELKSYFSRR